MATKADRERAKRMWLKSDGTMTLQQIAKKFGVNAKTVGKWKRDGQWSQALLQINPDKEATEERLSYIDNLIAEQEKSDLEDWKKEFCALYVECHNAKNAYLRASPRCENKNSAAVCAHRLLRDPRIQREIKALKAIKMESYLISKEDIVERFMKIAFADIYDFVTVSSGGTVRLKDAKIVDGSLIKEIKDAGDMGISIKLHDQLAALKWLADYFELNPMDNHKKAYDMARLEIDNRKVSIETSKSITEQSVSYINNPKVVISPAFFGLHDDIEAHRYTHYELAGGRGSTKSSFVGVEIVVGITKNPDTNAIIFRKVADTLKGSVYAQIEWAIDKLGVSDDWDKKLSPLEFIYKPTGQRIQFRGLDKAKKTKSIKAPKGYFAYIWFEELDEFSGPDEIDVALRSVMRGGETFWDFTSYNPPESINNWVNYQSGISRPDKIVHRSDYRMVPRDWLGEQFIIEAEHAKQTNEEKYNHVYLGIAIGTGGEVFKNVIKRTITDDEIAIFDKQRRGVDWGQVTDPMVYLVCNYDSTRKTLYIYYEYYKVGASVRQLAQAIKEENKLNLEVRCDSAEGRSTKELRNDYSINAVNAIKGPGSIERGIRWLAKDVEQIIIDPVRCPNAAREFTTYELEKDSSGNFKAIYPDKNNHTIDSARYACENDMGGTQKTSSTHIKY